MTNRKKKDVAIETLRGLAVILMVAGHVIGSDSGKGMAVADDSAWRYAYDALRYLRMPLFTVISGYVYAMRPVLAGAPLGEFTRGKVRRLLRPLLVVGVAFFATQLVTPGVNTRPRPTDLWKVLVYGYEHLWFLQSVFLVFLAVAFLESRGRLLTVQRWAATTLVAAVAFVVVVIPSHLDVFSIERAFFLAPYFLLGLGLRRFADRIPTRVTWVAGSVLVVAYALQHVVLQRHLSLTLFEDRTLSLFVGVPGITCLFAARRPLANRALAWMGAYSYGVYLFHVFGTAGARIALERIGIEAPVIVFPIGLLVGLGFPIVLERTAGRIPVVSAWAFGVRAPQPARPRNWALVRRRGLPVSEPTTLGSATATR